MGGVARVRFRRGARYVLFLISAACTGCGIWGNNVVKVRVIFAAPGSDRQLTNLSVIAGSDKYSWPSLAAGSDRDINLVPGPDDDRQLSFIYTFDGQRRSWDGPKFEAGIGYRLGTDLRLGFNVDKARRSSDVAFRPYEGLKYGISLTYGL